MLGVGVARGWLWAVVVAAGLTAVGLVVLPFLADLDTGALVAGIAGAVVSLAALVVAVLTLTRTPPGAQPASSGGGGRVKAGRGGIAAGGNITGSALAEQSQVMGYPQRPAPADTGDRGSSGAGGVDVEAGTGGIAAGGDITGSALGRGSLVTHQPSNTDTAPGDLFGRPDSTQPERPQPEGTDR